MKTSRLVPGILVFFFCCLISCKKNNDSGVTLSNEEKKLLGWWDLKKKIIEVPGQPTIEEDSFIVSCYMEFKDDPARHLNNSSPIFSNTKWVQDNKDCSFLLNAWKIDNTGKLLLASLDTVYADILFISDDSLAIKVPAHSVFSTPITYELIK